MGLSRDHGEPERPKSGAAVIEEGEKIRGAPNGA